MRLAPALPQRPSINRTFAFRNSRSSGCRLSRVRLLTAGALIPLESQPQRIVSTSVTLTGSLLAIDAPVIASGATTPNNRVADDPRAFYASGARWRKNANCNGSISANRAPKPLPRKCRI